MCGWFNRAAARASLIKPVINSALLAKLLERYYADLKNGNNNSEIYGEFLKGMSDEYREASSKIEIIRDFMAGMTDEYFLDQCRKYLFPEIKTPSLQGHGHMD